MAYTFMKALGHSIGNSLLEEDKVELAAEMMQKAKDKGVKFLIPVDNKVGKEYKPDTEAKVVNSDEIRMAGWALTLALKRRSCLQMRLRAPAP